MAVEKKPSVSVHSHEYRNEAGSSMFGKSSLDFKCNYTIKYKQEIAFGWKCVASMESYFASLLADLDVKSRDNLPNCDSVCSSIDGHQPSYDEFMDIKLASLGSFCENQKDCSFNVVVEFDFDHLSWVKNDGTAILDFVWTNNYFPVYNDIVVLYLGRDRHNHAEYMAVSGPRNHIWKYRDQLESEKQNVNTSQLKGFYFCAEDSLSETSLKFGTFQQANRDCPKIMTPRICDNQYLVNKITNLALKSSNYNNDYNFRQM